MDTVKKTGNILLSIIIVLFTIWYIGYAFFNPGEWFHLFGALGLILFLVRIFRGDD